MSLFSISLIYLLIFLSCFVFTLRYKNRLSKHDGDFPETLMKTFVLFVYIGGIFGLAFSWPYLALKTGQIAQSMDYSSLSASFTEITNSFINLIELK